MEVAGARHSRGRWLQSHSQHLFLLFFGFFPVPSLASSPLLHLHFNRHNKSCGVFSGAAGVVVLLIFFSLLPPPLLLLTLTWERNHKSTCQDGLHKHFTLQACQVQWWAGSPADCRRQTASDRSQFSPKKKTKKHQNSFSEISTWSHV